METKKYKCIVMRSGSEFWISEETAGKLTAQLLSQTKHNFIEITELNRTINTADIVEVCTEKQMEDRNRLKNKEWQCVERKWHKQKEQCFCKQEKAKELKRIQDEKERRENDRPLTKEEQKKMKKNLAETRKFLEEKGILSSKMDAKKI